MERTTRHDVGFDGVELVTLLHSFNGAPRPHLVLVLQFRPPTNKVWRADLVLSGGFFKKKTKHPLLYLDNFFNLCFLKQNTKVVVEFPAGLVDKGETAADAALRELAEETGWACGEREKTCPLCFSSINS